MLQNKLDMLNQKIAIAEQTGKSGGINMEFPKPTRDHFMANYQKLYGLNKKLQNMQIQLMNTNCNREELLKKKGEITLEMVNYMGIVGR